MAMVPIVEWLLKEVLFFKCLEYLLEIFTKISISPQTWTCVQKQIAQTSARISRANWRRRMNTEMVVVQAAGMQAVSLPTLVDPAEVAAGARQAREAHLFHGKAQV